MKFKLYFSFLFLFLNMLAQAQQNEEFRQVVTRFTYQKNMINQEFDNRIETVDNSFMVAMLKGQKKLFLKKMDSVENVALTGALVKVKNLEDLAKISARNTITDKKDLPTKVLSKVDKGATYASGIQGIRDWVGNNIYVEGVEALNDEKIVKTELHFVVEMDGSISSVTATGDNYLLNRQAMIALYLLPEKFEPATYKGQVVRSHFKLPISMQF